MEDVIAKAATLADSDTNKDDLVIRGPLSNIMDMAVSIPRMCASTDVGLYKTEDKKEQPRRKTFDSMDLQGMDVITVDEWLEVYAEHTIADAATLPTHPILVLRSVEDEISRDVSPEDNNLPGAKEGRRGDKKRKKSRNYATLRMCTKPQVRSSKHL